MKKKIQIAIDSPAASGAGTQAKLISKHYKLFYLDTGKSYRILANEFLKNKNEINLNKFKIKLNKSTMKDFLNKDLLTSEIGIVASNLAKKIKIRKIVDDFQKKIVKNIPRNYKGVCLDGRDITYNIMPNADFKFYLTASLKIRALRRLKELQKNRFNVSFNSVYQSIKKRDESDRNRKIAPLKIVKDAHLINTTNLTINETLNKIKKIIDGKNLT
tara:strand:+ start:656 stop:1303 length:648 start_codon:yes stop_codon:yes gene_type:complete